MAEVTIIPYGEEMTREDAIDILRCRKDGNAIEALEMAIEALEQEPILDKIRAEIDEQREKLKIMADDDWYAGKIRGYDCAVEIIDKYKAIPTGAEGSDQG